jgi:hypothetical protein
MKRNDLLLMGVIMLPEPASQFVIFCCNNNHAEQINNICALRHGFCDFCILKYSVADPDSLNPDPKPAFQVNPAPDPRF